MEVVSHIPEGGLGPLLQALREGGSRGGEGALAAAHAAGLIPQKPAIVTTAHSGLAETAISCDSCLVVHTVWCWVGEEGAIRVITGHDGAGTAPHPAGIDVNHRW